MRFPCPKPPLKVNDSFNCKTVHDSYLAYDRTLSQNVLSSTLVLYSPNGPDANTIVQCYYFYFFAVAERSIRRKKPSPGTRSVYNSTRHFEMKDQYTQFLSKVIFFRLSVCGMLVDSKIWYLVVNFPTLFQITIVFEIQVGQPNFPK